MGPGPKVKFQVVATLPLVVTFCEKFQLMVDRGRSSPASRGLPLSLRIRASATNWTTLARERAQAHQIGGPEETETMLDGALLISDGLVPESSTSAVGFMAAPGSVFCTPACDIRTACGRTRRFNEENEPLHPRLEP